MNKLQRKTELNLSLPLKSVATLRWKTEC